MRQRAAIGLVLAGLATGLAAGVLTAPTAAGQEPEPEPPDTPTESIVGRISDEAGEPVEGVVIRVEADGEEVGEGETDADGAFAVELDEPGTYQVSLDVETLPEGVGLRDPERATLEAVRVRPGQARTVLYPLGEAAPSAPSDLERFLNLVVSGLRFGLIVAVAGVGLTLVFGTTGLVNFAQGELVTFGALVAYWCNAAGGGPELPLVIAGLLGVVAGGLFGGALDLGLWRPLRRRRTGPIAAMVVSIGLALFLRHVYLVIFAGNPRQYTDFTIQDPWDLGVVELLPKDLAIILIAAGALLAVGFLLQTTRTGTAVRAVSDDRDLAASSGIDVERVILTVWVACGVLAALGGVLLGISEAVQWDMGLRILLVMFAAVILGGLGSAYGAMIGGVILGLVSEVSAFWFPTDYKVAFALGVLIIVLLVRPQGILGVKERIG